MTFQSFNGKQYLQIDIANNFGLDKKDWDERLEWFNMNQEKLEKLLPEAEDPALYYASVQAYRKAQMGVATSYPISLDATASGLQISACLTGCERSASLCNVIDTGHREDAYTAIYSAMLAMVGEHAKIDRDKVKKAVMTALYGSKATPKRVFGEGILLQRFFDTMYQEAPGAWSLNESFLAMWNPNAYTNDWVLPDDFHVHVKVMDSINSVVHFLNEPYDVTHRENRPTPEGRSLGANVHHSIDGMVVREMTRRCNYSPSVLGDIKMSLARGNMSMNRPRDKKLRKLWQNYERSGFLSARILTYIDKDNGGNVDQKKVTALIETMPKQPFEVLSVHDCFRCLPNYGNDLRRTYNQILSEIAASDLLSDVVSQIQGRKIFVNKLANLAPRILEANYALS